MTATMSQPKAMKIGKTPSNRLKRTLKSRLALSTVVTTLIIPVISVLLASVATYFAINLVSTRAQKESLALTKQHICTNTGVKAATSDLSFPNRPFIGDNSTGLRVKFPSPAPIRVKLPMSRGAMLFGNKLCFG